jgi:hypothetical protein
VSHNNWAVDIDSDTHRKDEYYRWEEALALVPGARPLQLDDELREPMGWKLKAGNESERVDAIRAAYNALVTEGSYKALAGPGAFVKLFCARQLI